MIETKLHTYSIMGTVIAAVGVVGAVWLADEAQGDDKKKDPFENYTVIDAALAEKAAAPEDKQPVKETRAPNPEVKPVGVSHDENAKPVTEPEKPKPDKPDIKSILEKNRSNDDDDLPVSPKARLETGRIDGVEVGFGDKTYGNPYLGALKSGLLKLWEYPEILDDVGTPVGCIQLKADGSIDEVKLMESSGNPNVDQSVETALADFKKKNNQDPKPLPSTPEDLTYLARMPLCWRMKV